MTRTAPQRATLDRASQICRPKKTVFIILRQLYFYEKPQPLKRTLIERADKCIVCCIVNCALYCILCTDSLYCVLCILYCVLHIICVKFRAKRGENFAVCTFEILSKTIRKPGTLLHDLASWAGAYCRVHFCMIWPAGLEPTAGYTFA